MSYICRTRKCNGHANIFKSALNPDDLTRESPLNLLKSGAVIRQSPMVLELNREFNKSKILWYIF